VQQETPPENEEIGRRPGAGAHPVGHRRRRGAGLRPAQRTARTLHAADVADLIEQISQPERLALVELWGDDIDGEVLSELDESVREPLLEACRRKSWPTPSATWIRRCRRPGRRPGRGTAVTPARSARNQGPHRRRRRPVLPGVLGRPPDAARTGRGAGGLERGPGHRLHP
jgi:hypothetical protein